MTDLTEMWEALATHQPLADAYGYGPTWAHMCAEKTRDAADAADSDADAANAANAADAAYAAAYAAANAANAADAAAFYAAKAIALIAKANDAGTYIKHCMEAT